MSGFAVTVRVTLDDSGGSVDGIAPGAPVAGGTVELARAEGDRDIRSGSPDDSGVANVEIAGAGTYLVNYTHNITGGALLADDLVDVEAPDTVIDLVARPFGLE